jgi:hypothetical protein
LKNIVNIDKFFSSGPKTTAPTPSSDDNGNAAAAPDATAASTLARKKKAPTSKPKLSKKHKKLHRTKLTQTHSSDEEDMESDIAGGVSDSQATAAAVKAVAATEETEETPIDHTAQQIVKETPTQKDIQAAEQASAKDIKIVAK